MAVQDPASPAVDAAATGSTLQLFNWSVEGIPEDGDEEEQVDYELDTNWDADDVAL